eukprot:2413102-Amphidinium_carterae.1
MSGTCFWRLDDFFLGSSEANETPEEKKKKQLEKREAELKQARGMIEDKVAESLDRIKKWDKEVSLTSEMENANGGAHCIIVDCALNKSALKIVLSLCVEAYTPNTLESCSNPKRMSNDSGSQ